MATAAKRGNSYKITASCGYDLNGKQLRHHTTWTPEPGMTAKQGAKELERQKVLFEERCRSGQVLDSSVRFADFADRWYEDYANKQLRAKTLARYKAMMPRINAAIGHIRLDKLQPHHLLAFYDNLAEAGIRCDTKYHCSVDFKALLTEKKMTKSSFAPLANVSTAVLNSITQDKNIARSSAENISKALEVPLAQLFKPLEEASTLSAKTILHHHRLISSILATAVQWQVIFSNPCERVKPPKADKSTPRYLDEKEVALLLEQLENEDIQYRTAIQLLLYTGFRRGELLGLEWPDVDFVNQVIHVRRSSLYLPDKGVFEDDTKNISSERAIKVSSPVFQALREFRIWQTEQRLKLGDRWQQSDRLFTAWDGKPMHPDTLTGWFHDFVARSNLPQISIHSLRHTNATLLIASHMPVTTVANRLGHANAATTTKIYAHAIQSADAAAAEALEDMLSPNKISRKKLG
ncbi:MAG: tyrosine-type recombinase/integrase [Oscillospiraceae bacterium]